MGRFGETLDCGVVEGVADLVKHSRFRVEEKDGGIGH